MRPDTYVGSIEAQTTDMFVIDPNTLKMEQRKVTYVPGLYKIFDEIVVNAADNKQRDSTMSCLKIEIDQEKGRLSVMNDGKGIPIVIHIFYGFVGETAAGVERERLICSQYPSIEGYYLCVIAS